MVYTRSGLRTGTDNTICYICGRYRSGYSSTCKAAATGRDEDCTYYQTPEEVEEERREDLRELYAGADGRWLMPNQYEQWYIEEQQAAGRWPIVSVYRQPQQ